MSVALQPDSVLVESVLSRGIVRDVPRNMIPDGGVYDAVDFLFDRPGVVYKRGGCRFAHTVLSGEVIIVAVATPEYVGDPRLLAIASDGGSTRTLYDVTSGTPAAGVNLSSLQPYENPPLYNDMLILTDGEGIVPPKKVYLSGGTVTAGALGGSPPTAKLSCVHLGYLVLANSDDEPQRIWFSPVPDIEGQTVAIASANVTTDYFTLTGLYTDELPAGRVFTVTGSTSNNGTYTVESTVYAGGTTTVNTVEAVPSATGTMGNLVLGWDTSEAYIDVATEITAIASIQGVLIVWGRGQSWRVLGSVPPGTEGEDMSLQPLGSVGCIDARSVVKMNGQVYFADESGVYVTNGGAPVSITSRDDGYGIGTLWADAVSGFSPVLGSVVCAGVWLNKHLFITVRHTDSDPQEGARYQFLWHQPTGTWTRLSDNVTADMYATANAPGGEIYAACGDSGDAVRLLKLSYLFAPDAEGKADANGQAVAPTLTFRTQEGGPSLKAWGHGRLTYDIRDAATDNPTLAVEVASGIEAASFTTVATLTETADATRKRFNLNRDAQAATVKLTQANASSKTEMYSLEVEVRPYDPPSEGV